MISRAGQHAFGQNSGARLALEGCFEDLLPALGTGGRRAFAVVHKPFERLAVLKANGDTGRTNDRSSGKHAQSWKTQGCTGMAAE